MLKVKIERAFTLIELLLVLAILGVAAGISFPVGLTWMRQAQLRATGGRIASLFNNARTKSLVTGTSHTVSFDMETGHATIEETKRSIRLPHWLAFLEIETGEEEDQDPDDPDSDKEKIIFMPDGSVEPAFVRIGDTSGTYQVTINCPSFGRSKVKQGE
jgi:type II secretion system protein H